MTVAISLLRGINVAGNNIIKMDALRALYTSLGLRDATTYIQSGNVVFQTSARNLSPTAERIGEAIEKKFGFRPEVIVRTSSEMKSVVSSNPFAKRADIHPSNLLINFMGQTLDAVTCEAILGLRLGPEEVKINGREIYIYFPDGQGRSKLWPAMCKALKNSGTGRNLNTVLKLVEMAEKLES
jgi:uncharacterized protein (DUF1697 family)